MLAHADAIKNICYSTSLSPQISTLDYHLPTIPRDKIVDYPDRWFIRLTGLDIKTCKSGFYYLSREGFEENKQIIKEALEKAVENKLTKIDGITWERYEEQINNFYDKVVKHNEKKIKELIQRTFKLSDMVKKLKVRSDTSNIQSQ